MAGDPLGCPATRSLWTPHSDDLAAADDAIARLSAQDPRAGQIADKLPGQGSGSAVAGSAAPATPDEEAARRAWHSNRLSVDVRPSIGAAALAGVGVLLWLGGVVALVRRGLDRTGAWVRRPAVISGAAILVGLLLWFVGLANA